MADPSDVLRDGRDAMASRDAARHADILRLKRDVRALTKARQAIGNRGVIASCETRTLLVL